jgi:hypothetical protein
MWGVTMISRAGPKEEPTPMVLVDTNVISEARKGSPQGQRMPEP